MKSKLSLSQLLGSKDFYPNQQLSTKRHYAERIGSGKLKRFAALFLSPDKQRDDIPLEELVAQWFTFNDQHTYEKSPSFHAVIDELNRIRRFHEGEPLHLLSTEALLNLYLWLQANPDLPETVEEDAAVTIHLFDLNLLFNDDVLANYEKATESAQRVNGDNYLQRLTLSTSFSQADLHNINYSQLFYTQFYKAVRLLDFLETTPKYQPLLQVFLAEFNTTKVEYFKRLGLAIVLGTKGKNSWNVIVVPQNELYADDCAFLDKVSITPDYQVQDEQNDYLSLRARPIERIGEGEYFPLFSLFLIKKMYNGTIFLLSDLQKRQPDLLKGDFIGHIRGDFSEQVLLYDVLAGFNVGAGTVRFAGEELKAAGLEREPDYYLRVGNTVVLHESKDFFMPGGTKLSYDFDQIELLLRTDGKGAVPARPDRLGKAVVQLAANIERVIKQQIPSDGSYPPADIEIFPVIVVYDSLYSAAGLNFWVHYWMQEELERLRTLPELTGYDFSRIHPVTLVEIDTLIMYKKYFEDNTLDYIELLRAFHQTVNYRKENVKDAYQFAFQSAIPFSTFVEDYCLERGLPLEFSALHKLLSAYSIT